RRRRRLRQRRGRLLGGVAFRFATAGLRLDEGEQRQRLNRLGCAPSAIGGPAVAGTVRSAPRGSLAGSLQLGDQEAGRRGLTLAREETAGERGRLLLRHVRPCPRPWAERPSRQAVPA